MGDKLISGYYGIFFVLVGNIGITITSHTMETKELILMYLKIQ